MPYRKVAERLYERIQNERRHDKREELEKELAVLLCLIEIHDSVGKLIRFLGVTDTDIDLE